MGDEGFKEMRAGRTDRSQYSPVYRTQVTDIAVKEMFRALNQYGASPIIFIAKGAEREFLFIWRTDEARVKLLFVIIYMVGAATSNLRPAD